MSLKQKANSNDNKLLPNSTESKQDIVTITEPLADLRPNPFISDGGIFLEEQGIESKGEADARGIFLDDICRDMQLKIANDNDSYIVINSRIIKDRATKKGLEGKQLSHEVIYNILLDILKEKELEDRKDIIDKVMARHDQSHGKANLNIIPLIEGSIMAGKQGVTKTITIGNKDPDGNRSVFMDLVSTKMKLYVSDSSGHYGGLLESTGLDIKIGWQLVDDGNGGCHYKADGNVEFSGPSKQIAKLSDLLSGQYISKGPIPRLKKQLQQSILDDNLIQDSLTTLKDLIHVCFLSVELVASDKRDGQIMQFLRLMDKILFDGEEFFSGMLESDRRKLFPQGLCDDTKCGIKSLWSSLVCYFFLSNYHLTNNILKSGPVFWDELKSNLEQLTDADRPFADQNNITYMGWLDSALQKASGIKLMASSNGNEALNNVNEFLKLSNQGNDKFSVIRGLYLHLKRLIATDVSLLDLARPLELYCQQWSLLKAECETPDEHSVLNALYGRYNQDLFSLGDVGKSALVEKFFNHHLAQVMGVTKSLSLISSAQRTESMKTSLDNFIKNKIIPRIDRCQNLQKLDQLKSWVSSVSNDQVLFSFCDKRLKLLYPKFSCNTNNMKQKNKRLKHNKRAVNVDSPKNQVASLSKQAIEVNDLMRNLSQALRDVRAGNNKSSKRGGGGVQCSDLLKGFYDLIRLIQLLVEQLKKNKQCLSLREQIKGFLSRSRKLRWFITPPPRYQINADIQEAMDRLHGGSFRSIVATFIQNNSGNQHHCDVPKDVMSFFQQATEEGRLPPILKAGLDSMNVALRSVSNQVNKQPGGSKQLGDNSGNSVVTASLCVESIISSNAYPNNTVWVNNSNSLTLFGTRKDEPNKPVSNVYSNQCVTIQKA